MFRQRVMDRGLPMLLAGALLLCGKVGFGPPSTSLLADDSRAGDEPSPSIDLTLDSAREALRAGNPEEAARLLRSLDPAAMDEAQRSRLFLNGKDAALRTGDRAWLEELNDTPERFAFADGYAILTSWSYLKAADFDSARFYLGLIKDHENLNEREKRRLLSIRARIEQFDGSAESEREQVDQLIGYLGRWASPTCMECHENPEHPGVVPFLDASNWWPGHRYVALLDRQGDADEVRGRALDRLADRPEDHDARLRLAYALRALGEEEEAVAAFRSIYWADDTDDEPVPPRDILTFP